VKERASIIAVVMLLLVALSSAIAFYYVNRIHELKQVISFGEDNPRAQAVFKATARVDVKVERQGVIIYNYTNEYDPLTVQWYHYLADTYFLLSKKTPLTWYDTNYNNFTYADTGDAGIQPKAYIGLGNGTGTPSRNDYKLFSEITKDAPSMSVTEDTSNQKFTLLATKSFTMSASYTITEVGYYIYVDGNTWTSSGGGYTSNSYLLVAHDTITPVNVASGDTITITYTFTIPYSNTSPFTRWFYYIVMMYGLGYVGNGGSLQIKTESASTTTYIDTSFDTWYSGSSNYGDLATDLLYIEIGTGASTVSPLFETYTLNSLLQRIQISDTQFQVIVDESGSNFVLTLRSSISFTSSTVIREIGVSISADINSGNSGSGTWNTQYFMLMYWILSNPISVNSGDGLRIEIVIYIPFV